MKEALIIENGIEIAHIEWGNLTSTQEFSVYVSGDNIAYGTFRCNDKDKEIVIKMNFQLSMGSSSNLSYHTLLVSGLLESVTKACENRKEQLKTMDV